MQIVKAVSQVVPDAIAALLRESPLSPGKVEFAWNTAVGAGMARATRPRFDNGVLFVDAETPAWSREVARSSPIILKRLQSLLGESIVQRIVVRE
jgi:predicted nucleic acid-binding Zn ribbon protein